jgi:GNAT superfamily N-acetyltransferase
MASDELHIVEVSADRLECLPCCGIMNTQHEGHRSKTAWLRNQLPKGLHARVLLTGDGHQVGYIEYLPGEHAWRGVDAPGYMFIHCLFTYRRQYQHKGNGARLIQACEDDARAQGMRGVAVMARKRPWMASADVFLKCGFEVVASGPPDYTLLAKKFSSESPDPAFLGIKKDCLERYDRGLTIIFAKQCPHVVKFAREIGEVAARDFGLEARHVVLRSAREARRAPTPYAVFSIVLDGTVIADHQISKTRFANIMRARGATRKPAGGRIPLQGRTRR